MTQIAAREAKGGAFMTRHQSLERDALAPLRSRRERLVGVVVGHDGPDSAFAISWSKREA